MRKGYQKVLSKDIGTQFNLVPPFPPVCPSPSLSLSFGVKTVMEMSHFTDNAYRVKIDFSITTTRKEEFSLTQWPIVFLERVVSKLFDQDFSEAVSFLLSGGEFDVPWVTTPGSTVRFLSGYPLGYLGAWPLFALSHHLILWWCAELVYPGRVFTNYAVLGDDVVIADENVATRYKESLDLLQVVISKEKSLISRSGSAEFAKNFRVRDLTVDLSPVSIKY
ncbi:hypothetical protein L1987_88643 [Smallanthus sonchifolius]|nr:hypothetical protein L1987_89718 [Smallanthus sonchifolius]KAI3666428.1 hypothetical protein L1987_89073 [Smallanthus sonchifolius]KAI3666444.1 hypothetical protein L1987_89042 [Smallanthus sonchifolius]KAI3666718.1 hypothetical protein L1987_88757 [Smallanthus sonchifolius]KAI3668340.1 hypothetical protein L1987_88685 [Smallanthus sonchifolius]